MPDGPSPIPAIVNGDIRKIGAELFLFQAEQERGCTTPSCVSRFSAPTLRSLCSETIEVHVEQQDVDLRLAEQAEEMSPRSCWRRAPDRSSGKFRAAATRLT